MPASIVLPATAGASSVSRAAHAPRARAAVAWSAVFAGAAVTAGGAILLFALAGGVAEEGVQALLWLVGICGASAACGGYVAARLRLRGAQQGKDRDTTFRDGTHGVLAWVVATLVMTAGATLGDGGGAAQQERMLREEYFVDTLFRGERETDDPRGFNARLEAGRILHMAFERGDLPETDHGQLARLVSLHTGIPFGEAERRVDRTLALAQIAAETLDHEDRAAALSHWRWGFIALLTGVLAAFFAAALGGVARDRRAAR